MHVQKFHSLSSRCVIYDLEDVLPRVFCHKTWMYQSILRGKTSLVFCVKELKVYDTVLYIPVRPSLSVGKIDPK